MVVGICLPVIWSGGWVLGAEKHINLKLSLVIITNYGSLDNAILEFWLGQPPWNINHYTMAKPETEN